MTPEQFTEFLSNIPYRPREQTAKGVLAPLVRSMGHILYLVAVLAHEQNTPEGTAYFEILSDEEKRNELIHAAAHLDAAALARDATVLSSRAKTNLLSYAVAVNYARDGYTEWSPEERLLLYRNLANRAAGLAAMLDRELIGLSADRSDAGTSL